ncbi:protein of unknown function [Beijerinckiaceae bacterium RH AL1]|nr:hypothetical protein [Beijerinckiaceae bacterium]VVB49322.1 protein of unknown function [Beijerinckiaceae bacterium RH CH11]VVB49402.1 protein of unknown function [Beijerinckiaceae bacterium RH AL8]VVC56842.1 protein of unknown function [Beijerinckiaceae bacterium RH AL1]
MQPLATSALGWHSRENEIMAEHETLLTSASTAPAREGPAPRRPAALWRVVPLAFLVAVGAALAYVSADVKDALITGRSVAHATH